MTFTSATKSRAARIAALAATMAVAAVGVVACGDDSSEQAAGTATATAAAKKTTFKLVYTQGYAVDEILAKLVQKYAPDHGIEVEVSPANDAKVKNQAVASGEADANHNQNPAFLAVQNEDGGYNLKSLAPWWVPKVSGYSEKYKSLEEVPDGATVAIGDDPANQSQTLLVLAGLGVITLDPAVEPGRQTIRTIKDNPHDFKFKEVGYAQLPRVLPDVAFAAGARGNFPETPVDEVIFTAASSKDYWITPVLKAENIDNPDYKPLIETYADERIQKEIETDPRLNKIALSIAQAEAAGTNETDD